MKWSLLAAALPFLLPTTVHADFGDYVDPTFNCPATTTCRQVCVANVSNCPFEMLCPSGEELCLDGTCAAQCTGNEVSPCEFACAPVACVKVIDTLDNCFAKYGTLLDAAIECGELETAAETHLFAFTEAGFMITYLWIAASIVCILGWCAFNQRLSPVEGSTKSLELDFSNSGEKAASKGWQTGYRKNIVGDLIYLLTISTLVGIQVILGYLSLQYYRGQDMFLKLNLVFEDEIQSLTAFQAAWFVGFVWTFTMKFPYSIRSLHYRRCELGNATHVAIAVINAEVDDTEVTYDDSYIKGLRKFFSSFFWAFHEVLTFVFSERHFFGCERSSDGYFRVLPVITDPIDSSRYIIFRFRRYNLSGDRFVPGVLKNFDEVGGILKADTPTGLSEAQVVASRRLIGENTITLPKPQFLRSLYKEVSKPFYTYQTFFIWTWIPFFYYYMAVTWTILIVGAALIVSFFQYRNETSLYKITQNVGDVRVIRDGAEKLIAHQDLVPGDVVVLDDGIAFCDMVVVATKSLLIDESALTGESNPVGKVEIDPSQGNVDYDATRHKRNTIFAGTTVLETDGTRAIVTKTASFTARGELIRDIYSYSRHQFKFDVEVPIVLTILFFYAITAFVLTNHLIGEQFVYGFFYGMYVVATILPPLLPTVFTVSVGISDERLARKRVACTNAESILVAGKVTRAFFDKTGTLTKQGLDYLSVRSASDWNKAESFVSDQMSSGMAVCHTLIKSRSGELAGNPVDRTMFQASGAKMFGDQVTDNAGLTMKLVKQFDFDHHSMTQSTIIKTDDGRMIAYVKGSGENIKVLCKPESVPSDFDEALRDSATQGIYQISMAMKQLPSDTDLSTLLRSDLETDLAFIGVINFKNIMREEAPDVIRQLAEGEVQSFMITGDSILTGIRIARECGIFHERETVLVGSLHSEKSFVIWKTESHEETALPSIEKMKQSRIKLALSGEALSVLLADKGPETRQLMDFIRVYGRCTPYDKVVVVSEFVKQGYITLMTGDGGNDCGALKTAHVGVALSDAEASTVAPFTSLDKTITSVIDVLLEGRCGLASAIASYKYMMMYGQGEAILQMLAAYFSVTFAEWNFVFMDGVWTVCLAFALPLSAAAPKLAQARPTASVLGLQTVASAVGVLAINFMFLVGALFYLFSQEWFECRKWGSTDVSNVLVIGDNYETETLFLVGGFQYIHSAAVFNFGYEFRQSWIRNYVLAGLVIGFTTLHFYVLFVPGDLSCFWRVNCVNEHVLRSVTTADKIPIQNDFNSTLLPDHYKRGLCALMITNAAAVITYEYFVVNGIRRHFAAKKRRDAAAAEAEVFGSEKETSPGATMT